MANQLAEYDGENMEEDNLIDKMENKDKDVNQQNNKNADKEPYLEVKVEGKKFIV